MRKIKISLIAMVCLCLLNFLCSYNTVNSVNESTKVFNEVQNVKEFHYTSNTSINKQIRPLYQNNKIEKNSFKIEYLEHSYQDMECFLDIDEEFENEAQDFEEEVVNEKKYETDSKLAQFYFMRFESGMDPSIVAGRNDNEVAVGLCCWTAIGTCNAISPLCKYLVESDSVLCGNLEQFITWSVDDFIDDFFNSENSKLKQAFLDIASVDKEKFTLLQLEYAYEEKIKITKILDTEWILEYDPVTIGTWFSVINWGPSMGWENYIEPSMDDDEIIWTLLNEACGYISTAGSLKHRWTTQYVLAKDLIQGNVYLDVSWNISGDRDNSYYNTGDFMSALEDDSEKYIQNDSNDEKIM